MLGKLVPCGGGPPIPLNKATLVVGRRPECDLPIACITVSGRHCELQFREGSWWLRDLGSKNGTTVNGVKRANQKLEPGDMLAIGRQRFVLVYQAAERPPAPKSDAEDVESLAAALFRDSDEPAPPAPPPALIAVHGPQTSQPHLPTRVNLGKLVPCGGGDPIPLLRAQLIVGRSSACDICLRFVNVSSRHCQLSLQEGYWFAQDLKSRNGTWVNGARCHKKCLLPNSVLGLASHRYTMLYTPTGAGPPPEEEDIFAQSLLEKAGLVKMLKGDDALAAAQDDAADRVRFNLDLDD